MAVLPALAPSALGAEPGCKLFQVTEWPVRLQGGLPIIEGAIDGKKVGILLDTGAYASLVTKDAAKRLDLVTKSTNQFALGFGGESRILLTYLSELRIGEAVRNNFRVRVIGEHPIRGVEFILGDDFFKNIDLEFDYAKRMVRLFQPQDCKNAPLGYWDANALEVPMESGNKIVLPVRVNGREARALLDSGASSSVISIPFARKLGITPESPGVAPAGCSGGIGEDVVHAWVAQFDSFEVGPERIRDPRLLIEDFMPELAYSRDAPPEVILGADFLRAHRVFVSRSQERIYFSYAGGQVFPATPRLACDDRKGKDAAERLAEYEEALVKNPGDAKALLGRALIRSGQKDFDGAMADLDAAIRLQPKDAVALQARASLRAARKDWDGAIADADAAMANGMHNAEAFIFRASIRRAQGSLERALAEYDEALKLDPTHGGALRARARTAFLLGRYEAADRDYAALLQIPHTAFDAIWLQMARARRGLDARSSLEQELTKLKGEWPTPVLLFQLGRMDRDALIAAASASDEKQRKGRECEARFYVAERLLVDGATADARALLERGAAECPRNYIEYDAAVVELGKLR